MGIDVLQAGEVTFTLVPREGGTILVLTHRQLKPGEQMLGVAAGWHTHLLVLVARIGIRRPTSFRHPHRAREAD